MEMVFPFFSNQPDDATSAIYHTHPRCRVAQRIPPPMRVMGTGELRRECPFCFLLAQFQVNRGLRPHLPAQDAVPGTGSVAASTRPLRGPALHF